MFIPTQLVTYMFVHSNIGHIFSNMLGLFFLGPILEMFWGEKRFLIFYLVTGIGAGIALYGFEILRFFTHLQAGLRRAYILNPDLTQFSKFHYQKFYSEGIPSSSLWNSVASAKATLRSKNPSL